MQSEFAVEFRLSASPHSVEPSWPGSIEARGSSGSYECHDLRDARPSTRGYSSGSFPNRYLPNVAIAFPKVSVPFREADA